MLPCACTYIRTYIRFVLEPPGLVTVVLKVSVYSGSHCTNKLFVLCMISLKYIVHTYVCTYTYVCVLKVHTYVIVTYNLPRCAATNLGRTQLRNLCLSWCRQCIQRMYVCIVQYKRG